jgi:nitrite reductase (NADH) small subunit
MKTYPWIDICALADIPPNSGVCAKLENRQIAVFHLRSTLPQHKSTIKAVDNYDPYSNAYVLSRGLITEKNHQLYIASPMLKQKFCLDTGVSEQDSHISISTFETRIHNGNIQLKGFN